MKSSTSWDRSERICQLCACSYTPKTKWQKACSYECGYRMQNAKIVRGQTNFGSCMRCGKSLKSKRANAIYCSRTCKSMDHTFKHRPKTRTVSTARRREIYERDNGMCYLCGISLNLKDIHLDHLIPSSRGGDSSPENLAVACAFCNQSRGSRITIDQLRKLFELRLQF